MIVLDEQLLSYGVRQHVVQWYRGAVIAITFLQHTPSLAVTISSRERRHSTSPFRSCRGPWQLLRPECRNQ
jgi:hypothetical protein